MTDNSIEDEDRDPEEPVNLDWLRAHNLSQLTDDDSLWVLDNNFPECRIWREGATVCVQIEEHIYTKYWWHKFHGSVFADAMVRAVTRMQHEGHPFREPELESQDDDVHLFVRWTVLLPAQLGSDSVIDSIQSAFDSVWRRANSVLESSDSVLILGKDTGEALDKLKAIESVLEAKGYYTYIIKEQPDRLGESVIQKVLRYALSSKFIVIENSEPSGHLYEIPQVAKLGECITAILQEQNKGATWMFEDAYFKHQHMKKFTYTPETFEQTLNEAATWAEEFHKKFVEFQTESLPWLKNTPDKQNRE
jgi:hypothetical protein